VKRRVGFISALKGEAFSLNFRKSNSLALFDFEDLVCGEAMSLSVDLLTRFFAGTLKETKDGSLLIIDPVIQVFHPVFLLGFKILFVSFYNVLNACVNVSVNVHIEWHGTCRIEMGTQLVINAYSLGTTQLLGVVSEK
jgi:hypothetical protein